MPQIASLLMTVANGGELDQNADFLTRAGHSHLAGTTRRNEVMPRFPLSVSLLESVPKKSSDASPRGRSS